MTKLIYRTPANRSRQLMDGLASEGYVGEIVPLPLWSAERQIEIDVDEAHRIEVASLVRELEPLAAPVLIPGQRRPPHHERLYQGLRRALGAHDDSSGEG